MMKKDTIEINQTISGYSVIWEYEVPSEVRGIFEYEYGINGSWARFFSRSGDYRGSVLIQSEDEHGIYLLIDNWTNRVTYETFKEEHSKRYDELSTRFEYLYSSEIRIGAFVPIKQN